MRCATTKLAARYRLLALGVGLVVTACQEERAPRDSSTGEATREDDAAQSAPSDTGTDETVDAGMDDSAADSAVAAEDAATEDAAAEDAAAEDAAVDDAGSVDAPAAGACCLTSALTYQLNVSGAGGFGPPHVLSACRTQSYEDHRGACTKELPACGAPGTDVGDLLEALKHPDVIAAFAAVSVVYGASFEGEGTLLALDGATVFAGAFGCGDAGSCKPIPAGVAALNEVLARLEAEGAFCYPSQ